MWCMSAECILQVYPWRNYSDNHADNKTRKVSVEKSPNIGDERRFSLDAVAAGVTLYSTSYHKPITMVIFNVFENLICLNYT